MQYAVLFFIFALGAVIGSFLNVVIFRFNTSRSLSGRSACLYCGKELRWYELIPIVSFLLLRGRCASCKSRLSIQYPLVEFITAVIFVLVFYKILSSLYHRPMSMDVLTSEMEDYSEECILLNLLYLEKSGLIAKNGDEYKLSNFVRKLYLK